MGTIGIEDRGRPETTVPSTVYGIERPVGERDEGVPRVGSLYDTVRHAAIFSEGGYEQVTEMVGNSTNSFRHKGVF